MVNNATCLPLSAGIIVTVTLAAAAVTAAAITRDAILNLLQEVLSLFLLGLPLACRAILGLALVASFCLGQCLLRRTRLAGQRLGMCLTGGQRSMMKYLVYNQGSHLGHLLARRPFIAFLLAGFVGWFDALQ